MTAGVAMSGREPEANRSETPSARLVSVGNVIIDLVAEIPALPSRGGDVVATSAVLRVGGGFNVLVAAVRQGMAAAYAGAHGTGMYGDLARASLQSEGIEVLQSATSGTDTGYDVALIDEGGERTFITVVGAEATLTADRLSDVVLASSDAIYVSGYGLLRQPNQGSIVDWLGQIGSRHMVFVDPGPLVASIPDDVMTSVRARADWWSCNAREAAELTGCARPEDSARELHATFPRRNVIVRDGAAGCMVVTSDGNVGLVEGFDVEVVDLNGAGDAHAGAFLAALARGEHPFSAARMANACAAIAVSRRGPATAPTRAEVDVFLASRSV